MDLAHEERLTAVEARAKSNTRRIDKIEKQTEAINRLATSVEVMATKQDGMVGTLNRLDEKVENIESKPAKRWEAISEKVILTVVGTVIGAVIGTLAAHFGL